MDKYDQLRDQLRDQVVWAITHYGIENTAGIIETLRKTFLEIDNTKIQNTSSNSEAEKCRLFFMRTST